MRTMSFISLALILALAVTTQAQTIGQSQNYSATLYNTGGMLGTGLAGSFNLAGGGDIQTGILATQFQAGGGFQAGAAGGLATNAGYTQGAQVGGGQWQVGTFFGPAAQVQGQQVIAGQNTVKQGGGPGGAAAVQVTGGVQGQSYGAGPFTTAQGSAIVVAQGGGVIGGPGSIGGTTQYAAVTSNQAQFRTFP